MNKYIEYFKERQNAFTLEDDKGFIQYRIEGDYLFITEAFVLKEFRSSLYIFRLLKQVYTIARENEVFKIYMQVDLNALKPEVPMQVGIRDGFVPITAKDNIITFLKILEEK